MSKKDHTEIIIILDRSGSMTTTMNDAIGGFNEFIRKQKEIPGTAAVTLTLFNHEYEIQHNGAPIAEIPELNHSTYIPAGMTALLDATGRTIDAVGERLAKTEEAERPEKVMVCIITDGEENSSKEYTKEQVREKIFHQRDTYQWEFIFLGADIDAFAESGKIGITAQNTVSYKGTDTMAAYSHTLNERVAQFRTS